MCLHCSLSGASWALITSIAKHSSTLTTHTEHSLLYRGIKHPWDSGKLMLSSVHSPSCSKDIYLKAKCLIRKWCDIVELGFCLPAVLTWMLTSPNVEDLNDYNASFPQTTKNCGAPLSHSGHQVKRAKRQMSRNGESPPEDRVQRISLILFQSKRNLQDWRVWTQT